MPQHFGMCEACLRRPALGMAQLDDHLVGFMCLDCAWIVGSEMTRESGTFSITGLLDAG